MLQSRIEAAPPFGITLASAPAGPRIAFSPGVRRYRIATRDGAVLGDLYGLILAGASGPHLTVSGDTITVAEAVANARAFESRVLDGIRGSFAAVTHGTLPRRLYMDCGATLPAVYCAKSRRAASSAGMLFGAREYAERFLAERHRRLIGTAAEAYIPGTLTAHDGVRRLLPNHYLDLETWEPVRYWPRREDFAQAMAPEAAAETVAHRLRAYLGAAAAEFPTAVTLTAGFDSRALLAASRAVAARVSYFTLAPSRLALDQIMAREIAAGLGLAHRLVPIREADEAEAAAWDRAVGHTVAHANRANHPSLRQIGDALILSGMSGELGRARYYSHDAATIDDRTPSAAFVLARMGQPPRDAELLADLENWLGGIAWLPMSAILDLAFVELSYIPLWRPAQCAGISELMPFMDRDIHRALLAVPPGEKAGNVLFRAVLERMWPEAMRFPVNRYGDYRDPLGQAGKVLQPGRVIRFLRGRLA